MKEPEDILAEIAQKETSSNQSLRVEHLSFTYPDAAQPSLQNLSFAMQQGQILGSSEGLVQVSQVWYRSYLAFMQQIRGTISLLSRWT